MGRPVLFKFGLAVISTQIKEKAMKKVNRMWLLGFVLLFGCASMFMKGGALVETGYNPQKVLVSYKAEGTVPQGVEYLLIETENGQAIFERSPDGSGALFLTR